MEGKFEITGRWSGPKSEGFWLSQGPKAKKAVIVETSLDWHQTGPQPFTGVIWDDDQRQRVNVRGVFDHQTKQGWLEIVP